MQMLHWYVLDDSHERSEVIVTKKQNNRGRKEGERARKSELVNE
jgi:hypothetical protein